MEMFNGKSFYLTESRAFQLGKMNEVELLNAYNSLTRKPDQVKGYEVINGKALVQVKGTLVPSCDEYMEYWGFCSMAKVEANLRTALEDFTVRDVILVMDSPGGTVQGTKPLADLIYKARDTKRVTTFVQGDMCSGGLFLGTAADEIYSDSPSNVVGSLGVYMMHVEFSQAYEDMGVKITYIKAGKYKAVGNDSEPLSQEGMEVFQKLVDADYKMFVESVAKHRNVTVEEVLQNWADAQLFSSGEAVENGLIDGIVSFDELIND